MLETIWLDMAAFVGALHVICPVLVRYTMRFSAIYSPRVVSLNDLPEEAAAVFLPRVPELSSLGFEFLGYHDCGSLTSGTRNYAAYFCNRATSNFASVTVAVSADGAVSYLEFSTRFANGLVLDTNTNSRPPLTSENPEHRVFRFPKLQTAEALYCVHRQLLEKYAPGLWPEAAPIGEELRRFERIIENFGSRHARIGYMELDGNGEYYTLTWKGACLIAWRGLWPTSLLRRLRQRRAMQSELDSLEVRGITALQKA
jgi:hypothetical protein